MQILNILTNYLKDLNPLFALIIPAIGGIIIAFIQTKQITLGKKYSKLSFDLNNDDIEIINQCHITPKINKFISIDIPKIHSDFISENRETFICLNKDFRVQNVITLCFSIQLTVINENLSNQLKRLHENKSNSILQQKLIDKILENLVLSNQNVIDYYKEADIPMDVYNKYLAWYNMFFNKFYEDLQLSLQKSDSFKMLMNKFYDLSGLFLSVLLVNYEYHLDKFNGDMYKHLSDKYDKQINFSKYNITKK